MKKKLTLIFGILIIIAGVGIALYPAITNIIHKRQQAEMIKETKAMIFQQVEENKNIDPAKMAEIQIENINYEELDEDETGRPIFFETLPEDSASSDKNSEDKPEKTSSNDDKEENVNKPEAIKTNITPTPTPLPHRDETEYDTRRLYGQDIVGIIEIPAIDLIYALVEGVEDENIGVAIGHFPSTAKPGDVGNCCLAGHNGGRYGRYFGDIVDLNENDEILITSLDGLVYTYKVHQKFIVEPTDTYILEDQDSSSRILTLVTCTNHGKQRLIVRAYCTEGPSYYTGE